MTNAYTAEELKSMKTLYQVNGEELKVSTDSLRVWLGADDTTVSVEKLADGRWRVAETYQG